MIFIRRHLMTLMGLCISVVALYWLTRQFDLVQLAATFRQIDAFYLVPVPILIVLSFSIRAQRWRLLLEHQPPVRFWPSFSALMLGYLLNNLLPARAGDVARVLELGRTETVSRAKVMVTLVTERAIDLGATVVILAVVLLTYPALPAWLINASVAAAAFTFVGIAALTGAHFAGRRVLPHITAILLKRLPLVALRIEQLAYSALDGLSGMFRPTRAAGFVLLTGLIWVIEVGILTMIAWSVDLQMSFGNALFVLLVLAIGSMVPASPGMIGTYEFFGVTALQLVGYTGQSGLAFVILLHIITLLGSSLLGVVCFLMRSRVKL